MNLIYKARTEILTRPGEPFNSPARVQRLADMIVELCNELELRQKHIEQLKAKMNKVADILDLPYG